MRKYKEKSHTVEAMCWNGTAEDLPLELTACSRFVVDRVGPILLIDNPIGLLSARKGDWIVRSPDGSFSPCTAQVFDASYEPIGSGTVAIQYTDRLNRLLERTAKLVTSEDPLLAVEIREFHRKLKSSST